MHVSLSSPVLAALFDKLGVDLGVITAALHRHHEILSQHSGLISESRTALLEKLAKKRIKVPIVIEKKNESVCVICFIVQCLSFGCHLSTVPYITRVLTYFNEIRKIISIDCCYIIAVYHQACICIHPFTLQGLPLPPTIGLCS